MKNQQVTPEAIAQLLAIATGQADGIVRKALVVEHETPPIISIPESMTKLEAADELKRQWKEEETEIDVTRRFEGWKWQDVLVAISITAEEYFGWIDAQKSFFNPPTEIQVVVDYKDGLPVKRTCFIGEFKVKALDSATCNIEVGGGVAGVYFNVKKKFKKEIEGWFELIDKHLRTKSIYRGKSVVVTSGGEYGDEVNFEITETRSNPMIVLNPKERSIVEQYCALDLLEKGKRTYLFLGGYGNGKTEAAMMLGDKAKALNMTFFYVKDSEAFVKMLSVAAKFYSPAFIFLEDIDEIGSGNERDVEINRLLNTLDGAETKNKDIKVLFTTNHHENINPALRRPGRLDLIARFENPTPETREEIYRRYLSNVKGAEELDYKLCSESTPDCSGAFVAEICKRAKRLAELNGGINNDIVIAAVNTIRDHLAMMTTDMPKQKDGFGSLIDTIATAVAEKVTPQELNLSPVMGAINDAKEQIKRQSANGFRQTYEKVEVLERKEDKTQKLTAEIHEATV